MTAILIVIHVIVGFFLILVVLLQPGKGMDLSAFGGGSTQTFFGVRGSTSLFARMTVASAVLFLITSLTLAILVSNRAGSVIDRAPTPAAREAAPAELPLGEPAPIEQQEGQITVRDTDAVVTDTTVEAKETEKEEEK